MNRNRLLIIISSAVAILGAFLPWASVSAGFFGAMSIRGTQGDGTFIAVLGVIAIVLACLQDNKTALPRNFATGVAVIGALQTLIMLINLLNLSRVFGSQGAALKSYGSAFTSASASCSTSSPVLRLPFSAQWHSPAASSRRTR